MKNLLITSDGYANILRDAIFLPKKGIRIGSFPSISIFHYGNSLYISGSFYPIGEAGITNQNCGNITDCVFVLCDYDFSSLSRLVPKTLSVRSLLILGIASAKDQHPFAIRIFTPIPKCGKCEIMYTRNYIMLRGRLTTSRSC